MSKEKISRVCEAHPPSGQLREGTSKNPKPLPFPVSRPLLPPVKALDVPQLRGAPSFMPPFQDLLPHPRLAEDPMDSRPAKGEG